jgi:serpin B
LLALALAPQQPDPAALAASNAKFALALLREIDDEPGNLLFSPHSIAQALSMARAGAAGETGKAMDAALHLPDGGAGDGFRALAEALKSPHSKLLDGDAYTISIATSMWGQRGYEYAPGFLESLKRGFGASFFDLDFGKPDAARKEINAWVARETRDRIVDLLPQGQPPATSRLVLVDAIYLKAAWMDAFDSEPTLAKPFHAAGGREVQAWTMHHVKHHAYGETDRAQVVALSYYGGLEMVIVLPKPPSNPADVAQHEDFARWTGQLARCRVDLSLPRFTYRSSRDLKPVLAELGMGIAFDRTRADFSRITKREQLAIEAVFHQAFIAVDEKGTEAAAATAVVVGVTSMPREADPVRMVVDRPFLFFIRHAATGAVLFLGRVDDPTAG